jgi:hypothetical protein
VKFNDVQKSFTWHDAAKTIPFRGTKVLIDDGRGNVLVAERVGPKEDEWRWAAGDKTFERGTIKHWTEFPPPVSCVHIADYENCPDCWAGHHARPGWPP